MILHQNHRHWEMQRESGSPRCPLASTNEISKTGMTYAAKRKNENKILKKNQNCELAYHFHLPDVAEQESHRTDRTRTWTRCVCPSGAQTSCKSSFPNDLPSEKRPPNRYCSLKPALSSWLFGRSRFQLQGPLQPPLACS